MSDETCCGACGYPVHATKEMACDWCRKSADRIEALIAEQSNLVVAAHRQGYDQARAVSSELRRAMAERIMEHEAKLAKAEAGLREIAGECGCFIALATLAEIKGT